MSKVSLLQSFANALLGIRNAAMDIYLQWEANDPSLGPRRCGPHFEDYVSGPTDLDGLWAWLKETETEIDAETFKKKVEEEGVDAFRPCEVLSCDWQEDIAIGIDYAKELAGRGLAEVIIPPSGKGSKQWLMEVLHCADEAKKFVIFAGLTPTTLECDSDPANCPNRAAARRNECVKQRHEQVQQLPAVAETLLEYRQWIITQLCVETTEDGLNTKAAPSATTSSTTPVSNPLGINSEKFDYPGPVCLIPEQQTFYLHYWPNRPIYVCLRDCKKRPFDFNRGAFKPTAELQDISHACLRAAEKPEWRADYGCSYSVNVNLAPIKARDDNPTGLKDGDHFELFWLLQTGDNPSPNQDKRVGSSCRLALTDGCFTPVDTSSAEMLDERLLFAKRESGLQEAVKFREAEHQWLETVCNRRDRAVRDADIQQLLLVLADDLCSWGDNLKDNLFYYCNQRANDELTRSFQTHPYPGPGRIELQIPWVVRDIVASYEAYEMLEFHKSREYAHAFAERFDTLHQARVEFSRKIVEYTAEFGRDIVLEPFLVLDEIRQQLRVQARSLAQHAALVANQFPKRSEHQSLDTADAPLAKGDQSAMQQTALPVTQNQPGATPIGHGEAGLPTVPWWKDIDPRAPDWNWEPEWLSVADLSPDAILDIAENFRVIINEMQTDPYAVGRWAELRVLEDCEKLAILAAGYGLDPKSLLQTAWNIDKNRFKAGEWPFPDAFRSCSFLLTEIETRAKAAIVRRLSSGACEDEPTNSDGPSVIEQDLPYNLIPPNQFKWRDDPPVVLTPQQWRLMFYCLENQRATVQDVADYLWDDGTASDRTEAAIDSLKSKLNTRLAEANIPVSISRKAGFLLLAID